jgi:hypothetical protein
MEELFGKFFLLENGGDTGLYVDNPLSKKFILSNDNFK